MFKLPHTMLILLLSSPLLFVSRAAEKSERAHFLYLDASRPLNRRIDDLLQRMTLEEKVGQMNMPCVYEGGLGHTIEEKKNGVRKFAEGTHLQGLGPGGGFFTLPNTILHNGTRQQVGFVNELQKIAV